MRRPINNCRQFTGFDSWATKIDNTASDKIKNDNKKKYRLHIIYPS